MPFICVITTCYFALQYIYTKYTIGFTKANKWDDGGYMFRGALKQIIMGLYVKILTMIGLLGLNKAAGPAALEAIPLVCVMVFHHYVNKMYPPVIKYGSFKEYGNVLDEDEYNQGMADLRVDDPKKLSFMLTDMVPPAYEAQYIQPALKPLPEFVSQSGVKSPGARGAHDRGEDLEAQHSPAVALAKEASDEKHSQKSYHTADDDPSSKINKTDAQFEDA
uniref:CSC1/OSCA1-like 7TM region domain-containing protein n=1 Tax=Erythrolobus madagascarensis TaxID=708628 RepID=A0A7S0T5P3_9RHOD|mmetsp:Transcript_3437/g.7431  ORF Transcript_3437/g.7431 Transcript_3437/m.7431 type:complete len:220 (+) Transcript_3437:3-662(+)